MARKVKLSIKARGETDSPSVDDFLEQVRSYFDILNGVEQAISEDGTNEIQWRIVDATTNSPIALEAEAYPVHYAVNVDRRAELVVRETSIGLQTIYRRGERPPHFTDKVLKHVHDLFERVTNGLDSTIIDFGPGLPRLELTPPVARVGTVNVSAILTPTDKPYKELGAIEGIAKSFERDGRGRLLFWIHVRLTGDDVKCFASGEAENELGGHLIREVWRGRRVQVYGTLNYKGIGKLSHIEAIRVRFLRDRSELPTVEDILDPDFTGGLRSEDYLARLRDGERS
jgi:hypothetical protein